MKWIGEGRFTKQAVRMLSENVRGIFVPSSAGICIMAKTSTIYSIIILRVVLLWAKNLLGNCCLNNMSVKYGSGCSGIRLNIDFAH